MQASASAAQKKDVGRQDCPPGEKRDCGIPCPGLLANDDCKRDREPGDDYARKRTGQPLGPKISGGGGTGDDRQGEYAALAFTGDDVEERGDHEQRYEPDEHECDIEVADGKSQRIVRCTCRK